MGDLVKDVVNKNHVVCTETAALLVSADTGAKLLGIGRSHFYGLHSSGRLGPMPVKLGNRTLWRRKDLELWVDAGCPGRQQWQDRTNKLNA